MSDTVKAVGAVVGVFFGAVVLLFALETVGIVNTKIFGVARQNATTEVFYGTDAYRSGVQQRFANLLNEYSTTNPDLRPIVVAKMRREALSIPQDLVPVEVRDILRLNNAQ